ncbi:zinc-dependent alcohol dehydrogenase [Ferruginivarius sediminum]|uniref:Enoyl reductase (ER) domain-containing protein n=1 Tax=Ferruginivarius sediminum TaxID=2661937 RepID=A0A369TG70_9PROT|nr:zinc-binding dehydrogenase [Ferruginivarius sediminum]RDD61896.1 hypothetical protein DRB17_10415 [Ferruginivarius sediminum]
MEQHQVAVFTGPGEVELRREDVPVLGRGEALVRLRACALCTMEQRLWQGRQSDYPIAPGHEAAGVVEAVHGEGVLSAVPGDPVAVAFLDRCMQCDNCRRGETHLCTGKMAGRAPGRFRRIGGLSEYAVVPAWKLFRMPADLSFDEIALSEPVACVVHSIHKGKLRLGDDVLVIGGGTMGHLHVRLARLRGARVFLSEPSPEKRELALAHGAHAAFAPEEAAEVLREATGGRGVDAVFVTFGSAATAAQASESVRNGGRIVYYGSFPGDAEVGLGPSALHRREIVLDGARSQTMEDWSEATRLLANGILDLGYLVSARYPLADLGKALQHAVDASAFRIVVNA